MGKSYCPGWSHTVDEGNFCAKTPAYLCGNQPVSQVLAISAPRPSERPKLGHDRRGIHSSSESEQHVTQTSREPELKHNLNFSHRLPMEAKKFSKVDKDWTKIMRGLGVRRCCGAFTSLI